MAKTFIGKHCILELYGCPSDLIDDAGEILAAVKAAAAVCRSRVIETASHRFSPHGVTAVALLAESHLSVHTWPEGGYVAVDIFACGDESRPEEACRFLAERLGAAKSSLAVLLRGQGAHSETLSAKENA